MNQYQQTQHNMQMSSGLTRYRSAPSSYFAAFLNNTDGGFGADEFGQLFNPRASSPETERIFSRFMNSPENIQQNSQFLPPIKNELETEQPRQELQRDQSSDYGSSVLFQSSGAVNSAVGSSYDGILDANRVPKIKMDGGGGGSGLVRHRSTPAGLFDNINIESDFGAMRGIGNFGAGNIANAEATFSSASKFTGQTDFSSRYSSSSSSGITPPSSQVENKSIGENNLGDKELGEDHDYLINPWDDPTILSDEFLKGLSETDSKLFPKAEVPDNQGSTFTIIKVPLNFLPAEPRSVENNEGGNRSTVPLSHHLSLPKSPAMEKLLRDAVPCKIRAKRGCATHPRSIAERVRRTKISERMRKLQELVPNMEKQTNTADMLDLAVDYIKDLQSKVKMLSDNHAKCSCSAKKQIIDQRAS